VRFIETPVFTSSVTRLLDDESYRQPQLALMLRPEQGRSSLAQAGCAKSDGRGPAVARRGGFRVIYYWASKDATFYMLFAYAKNEQGELTAVQAKALGRLVREEFK
jgi:mRNA-degrading endonuclease RelE of RelBE toxin-antitoxin system